MGRWGRPRRRPEHSDAADQEPATEPSPAISADCGPPVSRPRHLRLHDAAPHPVVTGRIDVPQIVVGEPSPAVEAAVIGPDYRGVPFRPDTVIDGWSTPWMTMRGVSLRGHLHRYNGAPRQDDFAVHHLPGDRVVVAVADGVSSAPQSHIGANAATRYAVQWLQSHCTQPAADTDWQALVKSTAWALTETAQTLLELPAPDPVRTEQDFATTLVCAVIEPAHEGRLRAYLIGIGDSPAWVLTAAGDFVQLLAGKEASASGISSSAVSGLPRVPADLTPAVVEVALGEVLLVGTDGIGDPLGSGQGAVGDLIRAITGGQRRPSLIEFAHGVDFSRETFDDDRTLVAVWPQRP